MEISILTRAIKWIQSKSFDCREWSGMCEGTNDSLWSINTSTWTPTSAVDRQFLVSPLNWEEITVFAVLTLIIVITVVSFPYLWGTRDFDWQICSLWPGDYRSVFVDVPYFQFLSNDAVVLLDFHEMFWSFWLRPSTADKVSQGRMSFADSLWDILAHFKECFVFGTAFRQIVYATTQNQIFTF